MLQKLENISSEEKKTEKNFSPSKKRLVFLSFRRGGSSLGFQVLQHVFENSGLRSIDIVKQKHGNKRKKDRAIREDEYIDALQNNELVGCFREPPPNSKMIQDFDISYVFLIRDPRDCDISWYYARSIHTDRFKKYISLEEYILKQNNSKYYRDQVKFAQSVGAKIVKYEDFFMNPASVILEMIRGTGFNFSQSSIDTATIMAAFSRGLEEKNQHNRSGLPYQSLANHGQEISKVLNTRHAKILREYGYPLQDNDLTKGQLDHRFEIDSIKRYSLQLAKENHNRIVDYTNIIDILNAYDRKLNEMLNVIGESDEISSNIGHIVESNKIVLELSSKVYELAKENHLRILENIHLREELESISIKIEELSKK